MKRSLLLSLVRQCLYPLFGISLILWWLVATETGLKASWIILRTLVPGQLQVQRLHGKWTDTVTAIGIDYDNFYIQQIQFKLMPWALLRFQLAAEKLEVSGASGVLQQSEPRAFFIHELKVSGSLSFPSNVLRVQIQSLKADLKKKALWLSGDFILQKGIPKPGILQVRYDDQIWRFCSGVLYWQKDHQPLFRFEITQSFNPKTKALEWKLPHFPLRALCLYFPNDLQWDTLADLSIQYHPTTRKNKQRWSFSANFEGGKLLWRDTPYSWLTIHYHSFVMNGYWMGPKQWSLHTKMQGINSYLPTQGISLQEGIIEANTLAFPNKAIQFSANGKMRIGNSWLNIQSKAFNTWTVSGTDIPLYNTYSLSAVGSPQLTLHYASPVLLAEGQIAINKATIKLKEQINQSVISHDVRFIDNVDTQELDSSAFTTFSLQPDIQVSLKNVKLQGYGLSGTLEGNVTISKRHDGLLTGKGEMWIDKGRYRLPGKLRHIEKGRLYYPSGTLLADPLLDIRLTDRTISQQASESKGNLTVQGTLMCPMIQLNNARQKNKFVSSTNEDPNAQKVLASQSALYLVDFAGNNNSIFDSFQNQLQLEEFNVESLQTKYNPITQSNMDTVLTVGKFLTPQLYLQYLRSVLYDTNAVKLKYFMGKHWSIGVETSTEGSGTDIYYSIDTD